MTSPNPEIEVADELKRYYQSSVRYRDDLRTHDERFLTPYIILVERYIQKPARILDMGCGTGLSTRLLARQGYDAVGVDLSPLFLAVEKQNDASANLIVGDALRTPFPDETFEAVAAFEFIEHIPNVPALLDEIERLLKPGGCLLFHSPNLLSPYLPAFDLLRMTFGGEGRPVWAESFSQAAHWLKTNLAASLLRRFSSKPRFQYRHPDLSETRIGGDADSVFLSNPMDIARHLQANGFIIHQRAHAMSIKNKLIATLTPNFAPYMGIVAQKRRTR